MITISLKKFLMLSFITITSLISYDVEAIREMKTMCIGKFKLVRIEKNGQRKLRLMWWSPFVKYEDKEERFWAFMEIAGQDTYKIHDIEAITIHKQEALLPYKFENTYAPLRSTEFELKLLVSKDSNANPTKKTTFLKIFKGECPINQISYNSTLTDSIDIAKPLSVEYKLIIEQLHKVKDELILGYKKIATALQKEIEIDNKETYFYAL